MSKAANSQSDPLRRLAHLVTDAVAEDMRAHRMLADLMWAPDRYVYRQRMPDTFAEFLFYTQGTLRHEPPAGQRWF
jgi:hypothetical protein